MIDWPLFIIVLLIAATGFVVISSAAPASEVKGDLIKQAAALVMGFVAWAILLLLDYNELRTLHWWIYGFNVLMLFAVVAFGVEVYGNKNWLDLGVIMVQPSELGKVLLIITLAKQLDDMERLTAWWHLAAPIAHVLPVLAAVVLQKDLGTALVFAVIAVVMVYGRGFPGTKLLAAGVLAAALVVGSVWSHYTYGTVFPLNINPGQWERIDAFLYPEKDPQGAGYQVLQSKMAIASGDIWGKGYKKGEYQQNGWLPFPHTDFAFASLVEEWGFVGGAVLLGLYWAALSQAGRHRLLSQRPLRHAHRGGRGRALRRPRAGKRGHDDGAHAGGRHSAAVRQLRPHGPAGQHGGHRPGAERGRPAGAAAL
jgi:Cell cycle protein.